MNALRTAPLVVALALLSCISTEKLEDDLARQREITAQIKAAEMRRMKANAEALAALRAALRELEQAAAADAAAEMGGE